MGNYANRIDNWRGQTGNPGPGFCAICSDFGKLTKDHAPPKGCVSIANSTLHRLTMETSDLMLSRQGLHLQGGLRFQTICTKCNSHRLGAMFDPELKVFTDGMRVELIHASQQPVLPQYIQTSANLSLVARAVIGHILAAHAVSDTKIKLRNLGVSESLRKYFLDPLAPFPTDWRLFCWAYFSKRRVILRNTGWMDTSLPNPGENAFTGHLLKFSPVAFWLTYNPPSAFCFDVLISRHSYSLASVKRPFPLIFNLRRTFHALKFPKTISLCSFQTTKRPWRLARHQDEKKPKPSLGFLVLSSYSTS
jgi:hypothetical protein